MRHWLPIIWLAATSAAGVVCALILIKALAEGNYIGAFINAGCVLYIASMKLNLNQKK